MSRREGLLIAALAAVYAGVSCINLTLPFLRHHESTGAEFGKLARNFQKFGHLALRFGAVDLSGPRLEDHGDWRRLTMTTRPILPVLYVSAAWNLFGFHEGVYRLALIAIGVANIAAFAFLSRRILGPGPASLAAVAFFALSPLFIYYSQVIVNYACSLLMIQLVLLAYWRWRDRRTPGRMAAFFALLLVGCQTGWPVYYAGLLVGLYELFLEKDRRSPLVFAPLACVLSFGLHLLHLAWIDPRLLGDLLRDAGVRAGGASFNAVAYAGGEIRDMAMYHTVAVGLLAAAWAVRAIRSRERSDRIILGLALLGLEEVVFFQWAADHDFLTFPLQLFFALAAARALQGLRPAAWAVAAVLFLVQSGIITYHRLTTVGAYGFYHRLARAVETSTKPDDKVVILTDDMKLYTPFYADRAMTSWSARDGELVTELRAPRIAAPDEEAVLRWIKEHPEKCDVVVTATKEGVLAHDSFLSASDLPKFQVDMGGSRARAAFEEWVQAGRAERIETEGFTLYRLNPGP